MARFQLVRGPRNGNEVPLVEGDFEVLMFASAGRKQTKCCSAQLEQQVGVEVQGSMQACASELRLLTLQFTAFSSSLDWLFSSAHGTALFA